MTTVTIDLPVEQHEKLDAVARGRSLSVSDLLVQLSAHALEQAEGEARFRELAARGDPKGALAMLHRLDRDQSAKG